MTDLDAAVSKSEAVNEAQSETKSFSSPNPFIPLKEKHILVDLEKSRNEINEGKELDMNSELIKIGKKHGFIE